MFPWFDLLSKSIELDRVLENIKKITAIHRYAFTPGLKQAATMIQNILLDEGITAYIEYFPADRATKFWAYPSKPEWRVEKAILSLISPDGQTKILADFHMNPLSVIQYSYPFSGELELVFVDESVCLGSHEVGDVKGKMVLTNGRCDQVKKMVVDEGGALGLIIYDIPPISPVRARKGLENDRYQTVFNWRYTSAEKNCFGFVLSPKEGERLRSEIIERQAKRLPPLKVLVDLQSSIVDDVFPVLVGLIPGETSQEIVVVSHLCHPAPSANDNASGNAAALEMALALNHLIREGQLPKPRRTVRFLWVSEMSGPYAYLSHHEDLIPNMVGGINLDMVGGDQCKNGSSLLIEYPSDACPSFAGHLLERLRKEYFNDSTTHTGMDPYPLFRYATTGFAGASDHLIFCDPSVGVPMPMLHQYPDRFHHSTGDVVENLDPKMLARTISMGAGFVIFLALASAADLQWLTAEIQTQFVEKITRRSQSLIDRVYPGPRDPLSPVEFDSMLDHLYRVYCSTMDSLKKLDGDLDKSHMSSFDIIDILVAQSKKNYRDIYPVTDHKPKAHRLIWNGADKMIPVRKFRGPTPFFRLLSDWPDADRQYWADLMAGRQTGGNTLPILVEFWADGKRTALEIARCIYWETGVWDLEIVVRTCQMLEKYQLMEMRKLNNHG